MNVITNQSNSGSHHDNPAWRFLEKYAFQTLWKLVADIFRSQGDTRSAQKVASRSSFVFCGFWLELKLWREKRMILRRFIMEGNIGRNQAKERDGLGVFQCTD